MLHQTLLTLMAHECGRISTDTVGIVARTDGSKWIVTYIQEINMQQYRATDQRHRKNETIVLPVFGDGTNDAFERTTLNLNPLANMNITARLDPNACPDGELYRRNFGARYWDRRFTSS
jgi:hypothetical protein